MVLDVGNSNASATADSRRKRFVLNNLGIQPGATTDGDCHALSSFRYEDWFYVSWSREVTFPPIALTPYVLTPYQSWERIGSNSHSLNRSQSARFAHCS